MNFPEYSSSSCYHSLSFFYLIRSSRGGLQKEFVELFAELLSQILPRGFFDEVFENLRSMQGFIPKYVYGITELGDRHRVFIADG